MYVQKKVSFHCFASIPHSPRSRSWRSSRRQSSSSLNGGQGRGGRKRVRCSLSVVQLHRTTHRCWIEWTSPVPAQTAKRYVKVGHPAAYFIVVLVVAAVSLCLLLNLVLCLLFFLHDCIRFLVIALFCDLYRMINVVQNVLVLK